MKRSPPSSPCCHDKDEVVETKRSRPSSPSCHEEDELPVTKISSPSCYSPRRYHYECELSEDDNSIVIDPPKSPVFNLVSNVHINFRVNYILRKRGDVDETLDSIQRCFYMRLYLITEYEHYRDRVSSVPPEFGQLRHDMEYDINQPEVFLFRFIRYHGLGDVDLIEKWIDDIKDFVNQKKKRSSSNNRVLPIAISIKVYTLQQEDETIDDAKQRAITPNLSQVDRGDKVIMLLQRPPLYKFVIEFDDHRDCSICLSKLAVGEEILVLHCSHAYHHDCLVHWLDSGKQCPLCRRPMKLCKFIQCAIFRISDF